MIWCPMPVKSFEDGFAFMENHVIFNTCPDNEFFGRQILIDYICHRATGTHKFLPGMFLFGKRWIGKTEVLRKVHQKLFWNQAKIAPVYYQFKDYSNIEDFVEDYVVEILRQYIAFIKKDTKIVKTETSLVKLERMLRNTDISYIAEFIAEHWEVKKTSDHTAVLRNAIKAPHFISQHSSIPIFMIFDDIDHSYGALLYREDPSLIGEFLDFLSFDSFSFLMASSTKKVLEGRTLNKPVEVIRLGGIEEEHAVSMMIEWCRLYNIAFDKEILALAVRKLEGNPVYIKNIMWAAYKSGRCLMSLRDFVEIYANDLIEGNLGFLLRSAISLENMIDVSVLNAYIYPNKQTSIELLAEKLKHNYREIKKSIKKLTALGLLEENFGSIKWAGDNVIKDFIGCVNETGIKGKRVEEVKTGFVLNELKEGFLQKGITLEGGLKNQITNILKNFNSQKVLKALFYNQIFSARYRNGVYSFENNEKDDDEIVLPQIIGCFDALRWEGIEAEIPVVIARGFQNSRYDTANEVIWIVGVKEAMMPVNTSDVENLIRSSLVLSENFRITTMVRWFVGKEGFSAEAQKMLDSNGIYSSDAIQLQILRNIIKDGEFLKWYSATGKIIPNKEFDMVLPMSKKAEVVAAKAAEEIGMDMGFDEDAILQIKTSLIEACINAFEHCNVKDGKVHIRFVVSSSRLEIHVQNNGVSFDKLSIQHDTIQEAASELPHKKGWGIKLINNLMDKVWLEPMEGGTSIVMVKNLIRKGGNGNDKEPKEF